MPLGLAFGMHYWGWAIKKINYCNETSFMNMEINYIATQEFSLMFFLAENLLNKGYSLSFLEMEGLQLIKAVAGEEICLFIAEDPGLLNSGREKIGQLCDIFCDTRIIIPVLKAADLKLVEEFISGSGYQNLAVRQFSMADPFIDHQRNFEERRVVQ